MKRIFVTILVILMVVSFVTGCTPAQEQTDGSADSSAAAEESESSAQEGEASEDGAPVDQNNDDLVGEGLGDDLGFGPVGYDMATLVERMGDKAHDALIAVQIQQLNEPWNQMWYDTLQMLAEKYDLNLIFNNAENDPTKEAAMMDAAVNQGADGIILFYFDPTSCVPAIDRAVEAGVPVVPCFPSPESKAPVTIGDSEVERGEFVAEQILKDFEGQEMVCVIANIPGQYGILDERIEGYENVLNAADNVTYYKELNILEDTADAWTQGTVDLLAAHEDVNCIIAAYGAPAVYCAAGVKQSGKDVNVYGIDADLSMCQKIKDGEITGLFPYDAKSNAYMCLFSILRLINGDENVPDFSYATQYAEMWLTQDNVEDYALIQFGEELQ